MSATRKYTAGLRTQALAGALGLLLERDFVLENAIFFTLANALIFNVILPAWYFYMKYKGAL